MADELALARQPLKLDDIITYVLAGLGQEYDSLASTITSRFDPITLEELYSLLLILNMATKQPQQQNQSTFCTTANFQQSNRGRGGYRGRECGGHFTSHDQGPSNSIICQGKQTPKNQPQARLLRTINILIMSGIPTRATHHLTNDVDNIYLQNEDYGSQDHIQVTNGEGLKIVQSGTSTLSSPSKCFVLNQILLVLDIQKNLLYVQHFCLDNNVFFEFHAPFFLVKDYLGNILHRGPLNNGLFNFSTSLAGLQPQALSSVCVCQYLALSSWSCLSSNYQ
ncbi:uncharacterized protein LOC122304607 [Carya illinoinensis]|uniref:uncharacterized protein LOC122304607 n=1 Tax=Carya illinoinensis TaxID=32201 RepID=UPI001C722696|nr:uncharacterized protein LOC122304607 [Carya illinoinensis]